MLSKISYQTEFQITAILSRSLKFTKLQDVKFYIDEDENEEVDQEILDAALNVIPNIEIE